MIALTNKESVVEKKINVAVVGATGAVGEALLAVLVERNFPVAKLFAVASGKTADDTAMFNERPVRVEAVDEFDFGNCQIAFFCAPKSVAKKYAPRAVKSGCWVIDVSSQFRLDDAVPLVVPEVNADCLTALTGPQIIASPAAPVVQAVAALFPVQKKFGLSWVEITTLLAVSAFGKAGVAELAGQTARLLNVQAIEQKIFPSQIAFNLLPAFDGKDRSDYTLDELTMAREVKKLLGDASLDVVLSNAVASVFYGHSQNVRLETAQNCPVEQVRSLLEGAGLEMGDAIDDLASAASIGTSSDAVFVSRCIQRKAAPRQVELWTVADNIRKGAAINSAAIAETLLKTHL